MLKYSWILFLLLLIFVIMPLVSCFIFDNYAVPRTMKHTQDVTSMHSTVSKPVTIHRRNDLNDLGILILMLVVIYWFDIPSKIFGGLWYEYPEHIGGWMVTIVFYVVLSILLFWIIVSIIKFFDSLRKTNK